MGGGKCVWKRQRRWRRIKLYISSGIFWVTFVFILLKYIQCIISAVCVNILRYSLPRSWCFAWRSFCGPSWSRKFPPLQFLPFCDDIVCICDLVFLSCSGLEWNYYFFILYNVTRSPFARSFFFLLSSLITTFFFLA